MTSIYCNCGSFVGTWTDATYGYDGEANCIAEIMFDSNGIPFCSEACYREVHSHICAACKDAAVDSEYSVCLACRESEPEAWANRDAYDSMRELAALSDAIAAVREKRVA